MREAMPSETRGRLMTLSISINTFVCVCLSSINPSIHLSMYLSVCLSVCLCACQSMIQVWMNACISRVWREKTQEEGRGPEQQQGSRKRRRRFQWRLCRSILAAPPPPTHTYIQPDVRFQHIHKDLDGSIYRDTHPKCTPLTNTTSSPPADTQTHTNRDGVGAQRRAWKQEAWKQEKTAQVFGEKRNTWRGAGVW